jgi:L-amino acid N-acyltransferase YncA
VADVSVRPAAPEDVAEIARIQVNTWRTAYTEVLPASVMSGLSTDMAAAAWSLAVQPPTRARQHVLVAQEQHWVVGFAAMAAAEGEEGVLDPAITALVGPLLVEPRWGRRGHGSRLLAAVVDHARRDGVERLISWIPSGDGASLSFFRSAGWETDGYVRALDTGAGEVRELRLHTMLDAG